MSEEKKKCPAIIEMGDDYGDNSTTFHCKLNEGHEGRHSEEGQLYGQYPYTLVWSGDMRETCERCGERTPKTKICTVCKKLICSQCLCDQKNQRPYFLDERCKDCPKPVENVQDGV